MNPFGEMFRRLFSAAGQGRAARTVELYGWLLLLEGGVILLFPQRIAGWMQFGPLDPGAESLFRMVGVLVAGFGMLYTISGRMSATGFVFASMLDRPLVPLVAAALWYFAGLPGWLALLFAMEDGGSFLWTFLTYRAELRAR